MLRIKKVVSRAGRDTDDVTENHTITTQSVEQNRNGAYEIAVASEGYNVGSHQRTRREILPKIN